MKRTRKSIKKTPPHGRLWKCPRRRKKDRWDNNTCCKTNGERDSSAPVNFLNIRCLYDNRIPVYTFILEDTGPPPTPDCTAPNRTVGPVQSGRRDRNLLPVPPTPSLLTVFSELLRTRLLSSEFPTTRIRRDDLRWSWQSDDDWTGAIVETGRSHRFKQDGKLLSFKFTFSSGNANQSNKLTAVRLG